MNKVFDKSELKKLYTPAVDSAGEDNGQITIIGGSELFHGAPIFALKAASRIVDMLFFATPEKSVGMVAEKVKSSLFSFIWVPWEDAGEYVEKSDAALIGPGFMRFGSEKASPKDRSIHCDETCRKYQEITRHFLTTYPHKKWVIDAGSLQVLDKEWIPAGSILTPNKKEYSGLFGKADIKEAAHAHSCTIVSKGPVTEVCSPEGCYSVRGGNPGLTKGGTGDILSGITAALFAKNGALLAAAAASYIEKRAADDLFAKVGTNYNADDLVDQVPVAFKELTR